MTNGLSICAVICVRDESQYLRILLPMLAAQGIDVAIIDNGSTDTSQDLFAEYSGRPIIMVRQLPYPGHFSLTEQLIAKQEVYKEIKHDWVIHHDADEVIEHYAPGMTLRDAIQEADDNGYSALNFDEFVFLPEPDADYFNRDYYQGELRYYFFEPQKNRLNRAWKRKIMLNNISTGGHSLSGENINIFPTNHVFRHYIVLGYEHAKRKFLKRTFSPYDLSLGWHNNRLHFTESNLIIPQASEYLFQLASYEMKNFRRDKPVKKHFWEWESIQSV